MNFLSLHNFIEFILIFFRICFKAEKCRKGVYLSQDLHGADVAVLPCGSALARHLDRHGPTRRLD